MGSAECKCVLFTIDATPVGDMRYPVGTEVKVYSGGDKLVAKVDGNVVASFSKSYEQDIRNESEKKFVLGVRIGDSITIDVMVPSKRAREASKEYRRLYNSGLALGDYDDEMLKNLMDADMIGMYNSMPDAWTGLALTLTGNQSANEVINTLRVMIRQNTILMRQNEMMLRELKRIQKEG